MPAGRLGAAGDAGPERLSWADRPDLGRFSAEDQANVEQFLAALDAMVENGAAAFGDDDADILLAGTAGLVELFAEGDCDGFLP